MSLSPSVGGSGKILITTFQRWLGRETNRSEDVYVQLKTAREGDRRHSFLQPLPAAWKVGERVKTDLKQHDPSGVLMMGEKDGSSPALVVETSARKYLLFSKTSRHANIEFLQLKRLHERDMKESGFSFMGPCNAVYRSALDWCPNDDRPIIFVHLPRKYPNMDRQKRGVSEILDDMLAYIGTVTGR